MKMRDEFKFRLDALLATSGLSADDQKKILKRYEVWGQYYDKRFFNAAMVTTQLLCGKIALDKDPELTEMVTPIIGEMVISLENAVMNNFALQIMLIQRGCRVEDLETPMDKMHGYQKVGEEMMKQFKEGKL